MLHVSKMPDGCSHSEDPLQCRVVAVSESVVGNEQQVTEHVDETSVGCPQFVILIPSNSGKVQCGELASRPSACTEDNTELTLCGTNVVSQSLKCGGGAVSSSSNSCESGVLTKYTENQLSGATLATKSSEDLPLHVNQSGVCQGVGVAHSNVYYFDTSCPSDIK